ncbi:hypothetical protein Forpi1262_v007141 [Fusarium oxysporum f. sp. raphani]|uniref:Uncharacterized protein n=1 Tax=Fusarium oxysporum f. sp. raphani TaxID=96318 RepID=A0A8J5PWI0_FUSOX|nr:hypothetical protein Forpi1262_v007141 [Fusarium oxysporum f. sp. raphani]
MRGYNSRKARTRRVHLVWKLQSLSLATAIEELLNAALVDDTLDDGYILRISIYIGDLHKSDNLSPRVTAIKESKERSKEEGGNVSTRVGVISTQERNPSNHP